MGEVERIILEILGTLNGEVAYQSDLVRQSGFSKSRVSEVLSSLQERGLISRIPLGKNFRIVPTKTPGKKSLPGHAKKELGKVLTLGIIRASEYPFVLPFEKMLREKMGLSLRFAFYDNGLELSRDLSQLRLDLGIAPVFTHFLFFSIGSPIKMIAPAGSGGASILLNKSKSRRDFCVATTKLSTMELMLRSSINDGELPKSTNTKYYGSPKQMMNAALSGQVDATCIWEPYSTMLLKRPGFRKLSGYEESSNEHICCAVAAGNHIPSDKAYRISKIVEESLETYRKNSERYLASFAKFMRFDEKLVRIASRGYGYPTNLDHHTLAKQFEHAGIRIPAASSIKDAVLVAG